MSKNKGGARFNEGKLQYSLLTPEMLEGIGKVMMMGAEKYGRDNWLKGLPWMSCYDSMMRHVEAWRKGEDADKESGLPHIAHALTNLAFLLTYIQRGLGEDNREK